MISDSELQLIGTLLKPHGIKGEINIEMDLDIDLSELRCVILEIEGINVPFFLDSVRSKSAHTFLIHIDGVNTDFEAKSLCGKAVYALTSDLPEEFGVSDDDRFYISDLIGYSVADTSGNFCGRVIDYDDSTSNTLLIVADENADRADSKIYIPIADEFVAEIDTENKKLLMEFPEGLLELNNK